MSTRGAAAVFKVSPTFAKRERSQPQRRRPTSGRRLQLHYGTEPRWGNITKDSAIEAGSLMVAGIAVDVQVRMRSSPSG